MTERLSAALHRAERMLREFHEAGDHEGQRIIEAAIFALSETGRIADLERELGLERESHETTKRMLADRDDALSARSANVPKEREIMHRKGFSEKDLNRLEALDELLAIHDAVMNPMEVTLKEGDTFTVKRVKEFIQRAVGTDPFSRSSTVQSEDRIKEIAYRTWRKLCDQHWANVAGEIEGAIRDYAHSATGTHDARECFGECPEHRAAVDRNMEKP
jgi:hypothetical protein